VQSSRCNHCISNDHTVAVAFFPEVEALFIKCGAKGTLPAMHNKTPQTSACENEQRKKADANI
jgi:hypothetical protein